MHAKSPPPRLRAILFAFHSVITLANQPHRYAPAKRPGLAPRLLRTLAHHQGTKSSRVRISKFADHPQFKLNALRAESRPTHSSVRCYEGGQSSPSIRGLSDVGAMDAGNEFSDRIRTYKVWGPPAVILAGFSPPEASMVKEILCAVGSDFVPVILVDGEQLYRPVAEVVTLPEPEWLLQPWAYNPESKLGNVWGSDHVILFSGIPIQEQATLLDVLESCPMMPMPRMFPALATMHNQNEPVGSVMAEAIELYRQQLDLKKAPEKSVWREDTKPPSPVPVADPAVGLAPPSKPKEFTLPSEEEMEAACAEFLSTNLREQVDEIYRGLENDDISVLEGRRAAMTEEEKLRLRKLMDEEDRRREGQQQQSNTASDEPVDDNNDNVIK